MEAFIDAPKKIPVFLRLGIWISTKMTGKDLLIPKILSWYPKTAVSSGIMEAMVEHGKKNLDPRMLKLVRIQASMAVACPFCIDMNVFEYEKLGISDEIIKSLQSQAPYEALQGLSNREKLAVEYTRQVSKTPVVVASSLMEELKANFTERELVILASTIAQVNYWARLNVALGIPPAGFRDQCALYDR